MYFSTILLGLALVHLCIAGYALEDDYMTDFYGAFDFLTGPDPTAGFVKYVDQSTAQEMGLINSSPNGGVSWGVDSTNQAPEGRASVRLESKKTYNNGLVILDVEHMPTGCGTWPAFWMVGPEWPASGEIDILEGVNDQKVNAMTLHTGPGCAISADSNAFSGSLETDNCDVNALGQDKNAGCSIKLPSEQSYGAGLNSNKGGVYATQWTDDAISVYFFPRDSIPEDALGDSPDPSGWGTPAAKFAGACDIASTFKEQQIIFTTTFCGEWAGATWDSGSCASKAPTCEEYVRDNPEAFAEAFWTINSLKVYQDNGEGSAPSDVPISSPSRKSVLPVPSRSSVPTAALPTKAPTVPTGSAPPVDITSEFPVLEPSEIISDFSSTETPAAISKSRTTPVSSPSEATPSPEPSPTDGVSGPEGEIPGFKWPGAESEEPSDSSSSSPSSVASAPTTANAPIKSTTGVPTFSITISSTAALPSESTPSETAGLSTQVRVISSSQPAPTDDAAGGELSGFKWPSEAPQEPTDSVSVSSAVSSAQNTGAPASSSIAITTTAAPIKSVSSVAQSPSIATFSTIVVPSSSASAPVQGSPVPTSTTSPPSGEDIPLPTQGYPIETVYETVVVTVEAAAATPTVEQEPVVYETAVVTEVATATVTVQARAVAEETDAPALRRARHERQHRRRMTQHHARH